MHSCKSMKQVCLPRVVVSAGLGLDLSAGQSESAILSQWHEDSFVL